MQLPPPPPPIFTVSTPLNNRFEMLVTFTPGEVVCDSQAIAATSLTKPFSTVVVYYGSALEAGTPLTYRFTFAIDASGRARTIRKSGAASYPGLYVNTGDLAPSLASSRFGDGQARQGCSITYAATATPVGSAPLQALYEVASQPEPGAFLPTLLARIRPTGSSCARGPGQYRQLNNPAFERIEQPAGTMSWSFLGYDVDQGGRTRNVRLLGSSGSAALDSASVEALARNRYAPGLGYQGCTYHFYRTGKPEVISADLPSGTPVDNDDLPVCALDPKSISGLLDGSAYPVAFLRRRVEGIVGVSFDTAPWGAIGNIKVVASEPDEGFGDAARNVLSRASVGESDTGHRGCFRRIRFKLPPEPGQK